MADHHAVHKTALTISESAFNSPEIIPHTMDMDDEKKPSESASASEGKGDDDDDSVSTSSTGSPITPSDDDDKALPPDADPTEILTEAMNQKEEGNAAFKSGDLTGASRLYRRGASALKPLNKVNSGDEQVKGLLLSLQNNLSMVCFKQNKAQMSRNIATKALAIDPVNVKALYRRAVAHRKLGDVDEARADLKNALKNDPSNTAVKRELLSIKKELEDSKKRQKQNLQKAFSSKGGGSFLYNDKEEEEKQKKEAKRVKKLKEKEAEKARKQEWEGSNIFRVANDDDPISWEDWEKARKKKEKEVDDERKKANKEEEMKRREERRKLKEAERAARKGEDSSSDEEEVLTERELQMMRGYKKTSDGRTTSYFNNELSDEQKALLGSIAPKRLDEPTTTSVPASAPTPVSTPTSTGGASGSAWNQAGTWEEKDTSDWCIACLRKHLETAIAAPAKASGYLAKIKEVKDLMGDASVALAGGKKRYIFDYHATVKFEVIRMGMNDGKGSDDDMTDQPDSKKVKVVASGTYKLPDINSTVPVEEIGVESAPGGPWKKWPSSVHQSNANECRDLLVGALKEGVMAFVAEFNAQY